MYKKLPAISTRFFPKEEPKKKSAMVNVVA